MLASLTSSEERLAALLPEGHCGVALFFFISGFIISQPFFSDQRPPLSKFYIRRITRLEPPYIIVMIICFAILASGASPGNAPSFRATEAPLWQSFVASIFYLHGIIFGEHPRINPPTWSLALEVQFYLIAPFIISAYLRIRNIRRRLFFGAAVIGATILIAGLVSSALIYQHPIRHTIISESYEFMLGIVASDVYANSALRTTRVRKEFDLAFVFGIILLLYSGTGGDGQGFDQVIFTSLTRTIAIISIFTGALLGSLSSGVVGAAWPRFIGGACYSIYLVHVPVMQATASILGKVLKPSDLIAAWSLSFSVLIPASIIAGMLFYLLIERPCMDPDWPKKLVEALRKRFRPAP
jgi:peptidoglycan/LPS O-acetylase OafA/YrhL